MWTDDVFDWGRPWAANASRAWRGVIFAGETLFMPGDMIHAVRYSVLYHPRHSALTYPGSSVINHKRGTLFLPILGTPCSFIPILLTSTLTHPSNICPSTLSIVRRSWRASMVRDITEDSAALFADTEPAAIVSRSPLLRFVAAALDIFAPKQAEISEAAAGAKARWRSAEL